MKTRRRGVLGGGAILKLSRHFGFVAALLAALSAARAEVQEFYASSAPTDVAFVYSPDQSEQDSWLTVLLRKTGMDIWVVLMRDLFLMDSFDRPSTAPLLGSTLSTEGEAAHFRVAGGCDDVLPSAQVSCELERDLLQTGWIDPSLAASVQPAETALADNAGFGVGRGGVSFGNFASFGPSANPFGSSDALTGGVSSESGGVSPGFGYGGVVLNASDLTISLSQPSLTAAVPEVPSSVMLLIGAAGLSLAAALKTVRG